MYGVDWSGDGIDYAAEAAKRNAEALSGRCDELEREMAEKDAEIAQLVAKCSRLERALKQVLDYDFGDYAPPWKTLEVDGEMMKGCVRCGDGYPLSIVDDIIFGVDALIEMANAIGEAQRIMKEGEDND